MPTVKTLCGRQNLSLARKCLLSLQAHSSEGLIFDIHSDGTIDDQESYLIDGGLKCNVVPRAKADDIVEPAIRTYPKLSDLRRRSIYMRKIIDIPLMTKGEFIDCVDADVLAVRNFPTLFPSASPLHMKDIHSAYSLPWNRWYMLRRVPLLERVNVGLFRFRRTSYDLDYLNYLAGIDEIMAGWFGLVEQTLWSGLFAKAKEVEPVFSYYDGQVRVVDRSTDLRSPEYVIFHFVSTWRGRMSELDLLPHRDRIASSSLELVSSRRLRPEAFLLERLKHRLKRGVSSAFSPPA